MDRPTYGYGDDPSTPRDGDGRLSRPTYGYSVPSGDQDGADRRGANPYGQMAPRPDDGGRGIPAQDETPVCPRHPDRVAYVRCQRCGRPACPECQRPAAVGVLCVDCERELARSQRGSAPRSALGGAMTSGQPIVTIAIIALCGLGFLIQQVSAPLEHLLMFAPFRALAMPWTFVTSGFLHGGLMHLLLNMYALWIVGQYLERAMGHWRFAAVFLVSVIAGHVAVLALADPSGQSWAVPTVGASGGVFGLFGSLFVVNRRMGAESRQVVMLIAVNLVITFLFPFISWQGHLGGLVVGTATTALLFALRPKAVPGSDREALARRAVVIHAVVIAGVVALCLGIVLVTVLSAPTGSFPTL